MNALVTAAPETAPAPVVAAPTRFDRISQALHWITVVLIAALFASAWSLGFVEGGPQGPLVLTIHRSLGATLLAVAIVRLAWRLGFATRPPLPAGVGAPQRLAAALTEGALYLLILVQPLTGLGQSVARGRPFQIYFAEVPRLMARDKTLAGLLHEVHELTAWAILGLIGLHVSAALFHGFVLRDGVLASMWPGRDRRRKRA